MIKTGWAWVNGMQRPIVSAERMTRGPHNGFIKVTCGNGEIAFIDESAIRKWPEQGE